MSLTQTFTNLTPEQLQSIDLIVCQDSSDVQESLSTIAMLLRAQGLDMTVTGVSNKQELIRLIKERTTPPTDIMLDVGGVGTEAALAVIRLLEKKFPDAPLPTINFCSLDLDMGINAACSLRQQDDRMPVNVINSGELYWVAKHLQERDKGYLPYTLTLRNLLNDRLGCALPMDWDNYHEKKLQDMAAIATDGVLAAWLRGKVTTQEAIERMRSYTTELAESMMSGVYMQGDKKQMNLTPDAAFYGSTGFPRKGGVVFSLDEAKWVSTRTNKPILIMRNYDPSVVPLLADGVLGGLIVTSTYMASHLKLLCETYMVSGLFGMMPKGQKTMRGEFNEEATPDGPVYYDGNTVEIGGKTIKQGQSILICAGGNGIVADPPAALEVKPIDIRSINGNAQLKSDILNIRKMGRCFERWFEEQGLTPHGVKANINSSDESLLKIVDSIGLVRTEQMVAAEPYLTRLLKSALLKNTAAGYQDLSNNMWGYSDIIEKLAGDRPVKIRLYDFVHAEIFNKNEQKEFLAKYPRLDIHGGEALETWPELYRSQVRTIFKALKEVEADRPLEIMMPAVRTVQDVQNIKKIIEEEAAKRSIEPHRYSFGVMIETLDSCKNIEGIAPLCDFISFGTNDLTQQYTNIPRGDLVAHARYASTHGHDPFKTLAPEILELVRETTAKGRSVNPALRADVCGAQAADVKTALKLFDAGIDNVSVAPTLGNLFGLPMLLNYQRYDAAKVQAAPTSEVVETPPVIVQSKKAVIL